MKIFAGKKKFLTIPFAIIFGFAFFPFAIGLLLAWLVYKKVKNKKLRYTLWTVIGLFTLFFGIAWVITMTSPEKIEPQANQAQQITPVDHNKSQTTKPVEPSPSPSIFKAQTAPNNPNIVLAKVTAVIDGDTIEVDLGDGSIKKVRYIGIDTPESVDPRKPVQCFSKEATLKNKELVENGIVGLEKDVSQTDRYQRLLRYVYVGDLFVNQVLVAEGYASAVSYPPDIKHQDKLKKGEELARTASKGLWGSCKAETPTPTNTQTNTDTSSEITTGGTCKYSCSSPDKDCSDFSSHTEAQTFFNCCSFTSTNDPMRLDNVGVGDGIACENI